VSKQQIIQAIVDRKGFLDQVSSDTGIDILALEETIRLDPDMTRAYHAQQRLRLEELRRVLFELLIEGKGNTLFKEVLSNPSLINPGVDPVDTGIKLDLLTDQELSALNSILEKVMTR